MLLCGVSVVTLWVKVWDVGLVGKTVNVSVSVRVRAAMMIGTELRCGIYNR